MTSVEPTIRTIAPHALAHDGFWWHVRTCCYRREAFADVVFARILEVEPAQEPGSEGTGDEAWHRQVHLVLAPPPDSSVASRRAIELD